MSTLPPSPFMDSTVIIPRTVEEPAVAPSPVKGGAAADFPNPTMPTVGSVVPSDLPPVIGGTAAPFQSSCGAVEGHRRFISPKKGIATFEGCDGNSGQHTGRPGEVSETAGVEPGPHEAIPASTGGPQEAIAGSAPNTAAPAIAFDFDWRAFWEAIMDERIVLFEPFVEHPMFVIEDGRLQRWEA